MGVRDWSTIADDNGNSDPDINWAEGQMPSSVNDSARAMMAALAAYFADAGGVLVSGGSSNAYTLATTMGVSALGSPLTLMFEADRTNTGAATLAVDGLSAKSMVNQAGGALSAGDIVDGGVYFAVYNETADNFVLLNVTAAVAAYLSQAAEVTVASATTTNILGAASSFVAISGTTTITSFGTGINRWRFVRATGAFQITHHATSLICPTGANITTAAGDTFIVVSDGSSNARILAYQRASGQPLALTLADGSVTYAKMQDVSATSRVLGRKTAGAGDPEELTLSELLDFIGSATSGDILYRGASSWARLPKGSDGQLLTQSSGLPSWQSAASAGKLGQVLSTQYTTGTSTIDIIPDDDTTPLNTEGIQILSQAITPASSSSKVRVTAVVAGGRTAVSGVAVSVFRGSTCIDAKVQIVGLANSQANIAIDLIDEPATSSSVTYTVRAGKAGAGTGALFINGGDARFFGGTAKCTLTLMEILP
jgi:hypothetical protein